MERDEKIEKIYIKCGHSDMRKGIDGMSCLVAELLGNDALFEESTIFLFCGRKKDRYKRLKWEGDGFNLSYKRLDVSQLQWPKNSDDLIQIDERQLRWLLEGLSIHQPKAVNKSSSGQMI